MTERELLEIVHTLRSNKDCSDADLCEVIKAANQTINLQNLATLIKTSPKQKSKNEALKFTKKELNQMPHKFKKLFTYNKAIAHVRLTSRNVYEVRCMIDGVCYFGSSKDLEVAKSKFIESLRNGSERSKREKGKILFNDYFLRWMETVKKPYIKESTYDGYMQVFKAYIQDTFKELPLAEIDSFFLQDLINGYTQSRRFRTAKKIYNLLSPCFDYAVADGMLDRNPMAKVVIPKYEIKQGSPLTYEEEAKLLNALKETGNVYAQAYVFLVYTGLRVGELSTAVVNGDWIEAVTEKERKGLKAKIRKIPIAPNLRRCLPFIDVEVIKKLNKDTVSRHLSDYIDNHHTHDLRHTFITRAQEVGIRREIVSLWAGHAADNSVTTTVYTHLDRNKDIQLQEIKKFDYAV